MRANLSILTGVMALISLTACGKIKHELRGEQGTSVQGPQGERGEQGDPGIDGEDGQDGADAVLGLMDPCGDDPTAIDEVLIRLADGRVLVSFSANANGQNTRLSVLPAGNYVTTDGTNCAFSVDAEGNVN